jgi:hypothetical protein
LDTTPELKTPDTNVAGRKTIVKVVIAFMEELSRDMLRAMSILTALSCCVTVLKT